MGNRVICVSTGTRRIIHVSIFILNLRKKDVIITPVILTIMNKGRNCKNCGDEIGCDSNSDTFCSEQCGVEYKMEHSGE